MEELTVSSGFVPTNLAYQNAVVDQTDEYFNAIWKVIKTWDVNVKDAYEGYCGANGSHVQMILDSINKTKIATEYYQIMEENFNETKQH